MGEIVGAAVVAHVPPIVMSEEFRRSLTPDGNDISLVPGLERLRRERLDPLQADTIVVFDTHWITTFEHVVTAHDRRVGRYTSEELPRGMRQMPYDVHGDPELAHAIAAVAADRDDTWVHASDDPCLPIHYPTVNLLPFLQGAERWISVGVCQTATVDDFLLFGAVLAEAVAGIDRRVVLLGSGGMSHRFWPLRELRQHEAVTVDHIRTPAAREADLATIDRWERGDHAGVLAGYDDYRRHAPEGWFAHYLMLVGALGGANCRAPGVRFSEYESSAGTGQVHIWFDRPATGWSG